MCLACNECTCGEQSVDDSERVTCPDGGRYWGNGKCDCCPQCQSECFARAAGVEDDD